MDIKSQANEIINDIDRLTDEIKKKQDELSLLKRPASEEHIAKIEQLKKGDFVRVCLQVPYTQKEISINGCDPNIDGKYVMFECYNGESVELWYDEELYYVDASDIEIIDTSINKELIDLNNSLDKMSTQMLIYRIINGR